MADRDPDADPGDMLLVAISCAPLAMPAAAPTAAPPTTLLVATRLAPGAVAF
ncbi:hypothetical protein [Herbaspirillum sp. SJZ107]|uniref:hypothetical protein n=1 Tax=Herbaspirillum sp. SJZ107 TaxID=2572881 RepID=UPI001639E9A8|nr:hypothetical protein [Herbaspirillum sp. SJZ107]